MASKTARVGIQVEGAKQLQKALRVLGEKDAPFLKEALGTSGRMLSREAGSRAPGGIGRAVKFTAVRGKPSGLRAIVNVKHPGSRSMEFGRKWYGRPRRRVARGQQARPYMGIIRGDAAVGATNDEVTRLLKDAFNKEWDRIGAES